MNRLRRTQLHPQEADRHGRFAARPGTAGLLRPGWVARHSLSTYQCQGGQDQMQAIVFDFGNVIGFFDHRITTRRLAPYGDLSAEELFARLYGGALEDDYERGRLTTAEFI